MDWASSSYDDNRAKPSRDTRHIASSGLIFLRWVGCLRVPAGASVAAQLRQMRPVEIHSCQQIQHHLLCARTPSGH